MGVIYLDHHATTPVDARVLRALWPFYSKKFGNAASSTHPLGLEAKRAVEKARLEAARLIGAQPKEIVFTSGATESNNLALKGAALARRNRGNHIITVVTEHKSVLDPCRRLEFEGFKVTFLPVRHEGLLDLGVLEKAIRRGTILVSVMMAHNETGVIQPIARIAEIVRRRGVLFHTDAAQAVGKIPVDVKKLGVDFLSFTAHKIYGPKGVGALYVREKRVLVPQMDGGGHEMGFRSGTLNVPGIVGFGEACRIAGKVMNLESARIQKLRDRLLAGLIKELGNRVTLHGNRYNRLPNNLYVSIDVAGALPERLSKMGIAVSTGSACLSTSPEASYVLKAMGVPERLRRSVLRFGLGRFNTRAEIDRVIEIMGFMVK